ncbi:MAG: aminotransferase class III-fold pyridoxal phosphate-dependent enzyme [Candidatus Gracilibacteria bacterium]|nr:aminotransferase class III-fold pyridoxal phosphate-dependent enzyme [Candidatus Gracilibacteria bacterium]
MEKQKASALEYSNKWLEIIKNNENPDVNQADWMIRESVNNFKNHFNAGWLDYRKSVTLADYCGLIPGECVAVEWKGKGAVFQDILGREYLDWLGGYGMMSHGWSNPDVVAAVQAQLLHTPMPSQELIDPLRGVLARIIAEITPGDLKYSFFAGSGTEANEGAIKLAKMYTKKSGFIVAVKGFHGKTMGSLSLIGKKDYREPVGQLYGGPVYHVPFGDAAAVEKQLEICETVGVGIAAVMMEPVQGEAGAIVPPDDFWPRIRAATKKHGVLLIADEVQTGLGRTGKFWGVDHWNVVPDIMTMAKALGGGVMPISAFVSTEEIWQCMMSPNPFIHTTTTGGGALACSAAIAAINVAIRDDYAGMAESKGKYLMDRLNPLVEKYPEIYESITGKGLLIGQHFKSADIGYRVTSELFKNGLLIAGTLNSSVTSRIEPPIIITYEQLDKGLSILEKVLEKVSKDIKNI